MKKITLLLASIVPLVGHADWYSGKVSEVGINYDGETVTFRLSDVSFPTTCTCSAWAGWACLNPARASVDKEYVLLLSARAREKTVNVYIGSSCHVGAIFEGD